MSKVLFIFLNFKSLRVEILGNFFFRNSNFNTNSIRFLIFNEDSNATRTVLFDSALVQNTTSSSSPISSPTGNTSPSLKFNPTNALNVNLLARFKRVFVLILIVFFFISAENTEYSNSSKHLKIKSQHA